MVGPIPYDFHEKILMKINEIITIKGLFVRKKIKPKYVYT